MNKHLLKIAPPKQASGWVSWLLLLALALIWGSSFILMKKGLTVFSPVQLAAIRVSSAFSILCLPAFYHLRRLRHVPWAILFLSGLLGVFIPAFLFGYAQTHVSSSTAGILNALTPVFTFIAGLFILKSQAASPYKLAGVIVGLLGSVFLLLSRSGGRLSIDLYALPIVVATLCYGINGNLIKRYLHHMKPLHVSTLSLLCIAPFALVLFWVTGVPGMLQTGDSHTWQAFFYLFLLGTMSTAIALILFNTLIQQASPVFASSVTYLIPIVALFWGIVDGESIGWMHLVGMCSIVGGVVLIHRG